MNPQVSEYGERTTITVTVARADLPGLTAELHRRLGAAPPGSPHPYKVFLPADTRSFGLVAGAAEKPAQGSLSDLSEWGITKVQTQGGELWAVSLSYLTRYFGWSDPRGVRVEIGTHTGETYTVTVTYDNGAWEFEATKMALVDVLLRSGTDSVATALTSQAADRWLWSWKPRKVWQAVLHWLGLAPKALMIERTQLVEQPPQERVVFNRPDEPSK